MRKIIFTLLTILIILYISLFILGNSAEHKAEKLFYQATKAFEQIAVNPDVIPPHMAASIEKKLQTILEKYPKTNVAKIAHLAAAEFYVLTKKYDKAIEKLDIAINNYSEDSGMVTRALFLKGNIYEKQNRWDMALASYKKLRDKYPDTAAGIKIPLYIAGHYKRAGQQQEADGAFNEAVSFYEKIKNENAKKQLGYIASVLLMQTYLEFEKYEEAGRAVEDTINNYPSPATYMQNLPIVELIFVKKLQNPKKAIEIYKNVAKNSKDVKLKKLLETRINSLQAAK